ncbi:MAG TPA: SseB family protein [Candidatus Alectryocaccobium stercorigallinarum]|nr:SseB family protein [Candidatus Alectryocaccobium stercorigallinarum]
MIDNFLVKKIFSLNELFVLFSTATKTPFIHCNEETFDDEVFLFTNEDDAKKHADGFAEKKYPIAVLKIPNAQINGFLSSLYFYDVNAVEFYTGEEKNLIPLEQLIKKPDINKLLNDKVPRINPDLQITAIYFLQEARRKIQRSPEEGRKLVEMEEEMAVNLFRSRFIVAIDITGINQKFDPRDKNKKYRLITIKTKEGDMYLPCFSDINEFSKFSSANKKGKFHLMAVPYDKLPDFCKETKGLVVNPSGFNLLLKNESIERLNKLYRSENQ